MGVEAVCAFRVAATWNVPAVAHLYRRAAFAPLWDTIKRDLLDGPQKSVRRLLEGEPRSPSGTPASELENTFAAMAAPASRARPTLAREFSRGSGCTG